MNPLPGSVARHFPHGLTLDRPADRRHAIATLLEDGDRSDLAWLAGVVPRAEIEQWFDRFAARRLSRRSRAFWAVVLGRESAPAGELARALWPPA